MSEDELRQQKRISVTNVVTTEARKLARSVLTNTAIAVKVARLYSCEHRNVAEAIEDLTEVVRGFAQREGGLDLSRYEDFLFINEVRIRIDHGGYDSYHFVVDLLRERGVGELSVTADVRPEEIEALVDLLVIPVPDQGGSWEWFSTQVAKFALSNISFGPEQQRKDTSEEADDDVRLSAIRTFFKCCYAVETCFSASKEGRKANLKRLKRGVQALVDITLDDQYMLLALANLKDVGSAHANHAVNTAVFSVAIGAKLNLSKKLLGDLGIAALLHDIGKVRVSEASCCRTQLSVQQWEQYQGHVYFGPEQLLAQRLMNATVKSVNVAFLHHLRYDRTGFPKLVQAKQQNLFTRIVAVANFYDNSTTSGRLHEKAQEPEPVLRELMDKAGTEFDPLVVKAFVNVMGLYPVGCMVQLVDGEVGTVVAPCSDPKHLNRPTVRVGIDSSGNPTDRTVDLMERGPDGCFKHSILKVYQHEEINLELEEYLSVI